MKYLPFILLVSCTKINERINGSVNSNSSISKPNIILILSDDIGYECMGYTGSQTYQTPNIDRMALEGIQFTRCHFTPLCSTSRTSIMTGKYNYKNYTKWGSMSLSEKTFGNMFHDAGYSTCIAGKWQLDHGATAMQAFGFDKYLIWQPFDSSNYGNPYKNPKLYKDGAWMTGNQGKYGQDMFRDYIFNFIDSAQKPYFAYWTMNLAHEPFSPTPNDSAFASWVNGPSDTTYHKSMVQYMDKLVGQLLDKVRGTNTIVIFTSDNGTPSQIYSWWNDTLIRGGKNNPTIYGTHVPLIVWGRQSGINGTLIDPADFMPSMAKMAGIPIPYYAEDGVSFWNRDSTKPYLYFDFAPKRTENDEHTIWVMNGLYKKYDTTVQNVKWRGNFYQYKTNPLEIKPLMPKNQNQVYTDSLFTAVIAQHKN